MGPDGMVKTKNLREHLNLYVKSVHGPRWNGVKSVHGPRWNGQYEESKGTFEFVRQVSTWAQME